MSVALVTSKINGRSVNGYFPVATQDTFSMYWLPVCAKNRLHFLEQSLTGYSYTETHLNDIIKEVEMFLRSLDCDHWDFPTDIMEFVKLRANLLLGELRKLKGSTVEFFLG